MSLIPKEPAPQVLSVLSVRLEDSIIKRLGQYCEFLSSGQAHVVAGALTYVMDHDEEFAAYLVSHPVSEIVSENVRGLHRNGKVVNKRASR